MTILSTQDIITGYGDSEILHGVSLEAEKQEIITIIGPNGAGKSTLIKAIDGIIHPWEGNVTYRDEDITTLGPDKKLERGITYVPQGRSIFKDMTVRENLKMGAYLRYETDYIQNRISVVLDVFEELSEYLDKEARNLSGGQQQMVELGRALMMDPEVILVDEPSLGLAPKLVTNVLNYLTRLRENGGLTVIIVEQNAEEALKISDTGYVLASGENVFSGPADNILEHEEIGRLYLGAEG